MGFYNYLFSVPFLFFLIGYWWKRKENILCWPNILTINIILLFLYFCHVVSLSLALLCLVILSFIQYRKNIHRAFIFLAALSPSFCTVLYFLYMQRTGDGLERWKTADLISYILRIGILSPFDGKINIVGVCMATCFIVFFVLTVIKKSSLLANKKKTSFESKDGLLILAITTFFI